jgi:hypothetical protein
MIGQNSNFHSFVPTCTLNWRQQGNLKRRLMFISRNRIISEGNNRFRHRRQHHHHHHHNPCDDFKPHKKQYDF